MSTPEHLRARHNDFDTKPLRERWQIHKTIQKKSWALKLSQVAKWETFGSKLEMKKRHEMSKIHGLFDKQDNWVSDRNQLPMVIKEHFESTFSDIGNSSVLFANQMQKFSVFVVHRLPTAPCPLLATTTNTLPLHGSVSPSCVADVVEECAKGVNSQFLGFSTDVNPLPSISVLFAQHPSCSNPWGAGRLKKPAAACFVQQPFANCTSRCSLQRDDACLFHCQYDGNRVHHFHVCRACATSAQVPMPPMQPLAWFFLRVSR